MPVLDDWASAGQLLQQLDAAFEARTDTLSILLVDDGSAEPAPAGFGQGPCRRVKTIDVLRLKKNLGHQRAIAVGLCQIGANIACDVVVVMDSDGEDDPRDAVRLAAKHAEMAPALPIIFAERTRRSEALPFRFGYLGYRVIHYLLTGRGIRFGNFSLVPQSRLTAITSEPMLWNHYAASVAVSRLPYVTIPSNRGKRIAGQSRLNFIQLVIHGLSALSCYSEKIGVRLLLLASFLFGVSLLGLVATLILRVATDLPLPGWTSLFAGILVIFLLQLITLATNFTLQMISTRSTQPFLPARDALWYADRVDRLHAHE